MIFVCVCVCVMGMPFRSFALCYCCCSRCCHQPDEEIVHNKSACKKSNVKNHMYNSEIGLLKFNIFRSFMFTVQYAKENVPDRTISPDCIRWLLFHLVEAICFRLCFFFFFLSFYFSYCVPVAPHAAMLCCACDDNTTPNQWRRCEDKKKKLT